MDIITYSTLLRARGSRLLTFGSGVLRPSIHPETLECFLFSLNFDECNTASVNLRARISIQELLCYARGSDESITVMKIMTLERKREIRAQPNASRMEIKLGCVATLSISAMATTRPKTKIVTARPLQPPPILKDIALRKLQNSCSHKLSLLANHLLTLF
jgi:hypothetical protein